MRPREYAYGGIFGALALVMPFFFHLLHLGPLFLPMYLPLLALAFFVRPRASVLTAAVVPILSGCLTGMPPFYPPIAPVKSIELAVMSALIGFLSGRFPTAPTVLILLPVLLVGRVICAGLYYAASLGWELPANFVAGISFIAGWPGIVLMLAVLPPVIAAGRKAGLIPREMSVPPNAG